jgi:hypothetical protein
VAYNSTLFDSSGLLKDVRSASTPITGISFDADSLNRFSNSSDLWCTTWHDDGNLYICGGDGDGFDGVDTRGLDVNRYTGGPEDTISSSGTEIFSQINHLPKGIVSVNGTMYMIWEERDDQTGDGNAFAAFKLAKSTNDGVNWTTTDWLHEGERFISGGMFINYGQSYAGCRDEFVYCCAGYKDGLTTGPPYDNVSLARVPKNSVDSIANWEYFSGTSNTPAWDADRTNVAPIHTDAGNVHWGVAINYNPVLNRYLLCYYVGAAGTTLKIYEGPHPWGPWTSIYNTTLLGDSTSEKLAVYFINKTPGFLSTDGLTWWMVTSGVGVWDSFNFIKATLTI